MATDHALTSTSLDWLMHLPERVRPKALVKHFPRLVNSISEAWTSDERAIDTFSHLLFDRRSGRHGFPPDVLQELRRLRLFRFRRNAS